MATKTKIIREVPKSKLLSNMAEGKVFAKKQTQVEIEPQPAVEPAPKATKTPSAKPGKTENILTPKTSTAIVHVQRHVLPAAGRSKSDKIGTETITLKNEIMLLLKHKFDADFEMDKINYLYQMGILMALIHKIKTGKILDSNLGSGFNGVDTDSLNAILGDQSEIDKISKMFTSASENYKAWNDDNFVFPS